MTPAHMLQALATLDSRVHAIRHGDLHDIDLWCKLVGPGMEMHVLSDKTIENIGIIFRRYFQ